MFHVYERADVNWLCHKGVAKKKKNICLENLCPLSLCSLLLKLSHADWLFELTNIAKENGHTMAFQQCSNRTEKMHSMNSQEFPKF